MFPPAANGLSAFITGGCSGLEEQEARAIVTRRMTYSFDFNTALKYT